VPSDEYQQNLGVLLEAVAQHGKLIRRQEREGPNYVTPNYRLNEEERQEFRRELMGGSERATAILGAAHLDSQLEDLLTGFIVDASPIHGRISVQVPRPFGRRITMAFDLGLISEDEHHDLTLIKHIRNDFAHDIYRRSFQDPGTRSRVNLLCGSATYRDGIFKNDPRMVFVIGVSKLINQLGQQVDKVGLQRRTRPTDSSNDASSEGSSDIRN
jgi:hypothetical protein